MRIVPLSLREANAFVARHHRHHPPARGCKFCLGLADDDGVHGVAIVGRPVARLLDDGLTAEVTRLCTDGAPNACSRLYRAAWRACAAMGYRRLLTYTLPEEGGASLRGAGFHFAGEAGGGSWSRGARPRSDRAPTGRKHRWELRV